MYCIFVVYEICLKCNDFFDNQSVGHFVCVWSGEGRVDKELHFMCVVDFQSFGCTGTCLFLLNEELYSQRIQYICLFPVSQSLLYLL